MSKSQNNAYAYMVINKTVVVKLKFEAYPKKMRYAFLLLAKIFVIV